MQTNLIFLSLKIQQKAVFWKSIFFLCHNPVTLTLLQHSEWSGCNHTQMTMMDAIMSLDQLVDESDPDVDFPNSFHAFQTAEGIRQAHPDKGTMQGEGERQKHIHCVQLHTNTYLCSLPRLVPVGGSDPWCWEDDGSLGRTPGRKHGLVSQLSQPKLWTSMLRNMSSLSTSGSHFQICFPSN